MHLLRKKVGENLQGWISLHRKLMENAVWGDPNYLKLWIYCLFKASHQDHDQLVGNQMISLHKGQFVTGRHVLADDLNRGVKPKLRLDDLTWWRYLKNLEKFQMLNIKTSNKFSVVTIDKYEVYQDSVKQVEQQTEQQMNNKRTTDEQQLNTNNNVNKGNNDNKKTSRQNFKFEASDMELAKLLYKLIQDNGDKANYVKNPNFESWANTIRLMRTSDKKTHEQIEFLINWTQKHNFWHTVILSPDNLRKNFEQLVIKVKAERNKEKVPAAKGRSKEDFDFSE